MPLKNFNLIGRYTTIGHIHESPHQFLFIFDGTRRAG